MENSQIGDLIDYLEEIAPLHYQESYDNSGLIYGNRSKVITGVLISLDLTEQVLEEAIEKGCNVVVSHHPIIFSGIKKFSGHYVDRTIEMAIKNDMAIYAIHTNLDNVLDNGVNSKIAEILGLEDIAVLVEKKDLDPNQRVGSGVLGNLNTSMEAGQFLDMLKDKMELKVVKHTALLKNKIRKIAVCGGSGSFLLPAAIACVADVFITADFKYHEFFDADGKIVIIDIGHYESERFTINLLYDLITKKFSNFAAHCTKWDTNPVKYY